MLFLPAPSIQIAANRQRQEFDESKLQELATSITNNGLLQPVVVRASGDSAGGYQLVCGERRLRAIAQLRFIGNALRFDSQVVPGESIPCVLLGDLDELAAEEAEFDENIRRVDLTWQEKAAATAKLASIRQKRLKAAEATGDFAAIKAAEKAASVSALAQELNPAQESAATPGSRAQQNVHRDLVLAKHMDNPEVKGAKTADEAFKALKRAEEVRKNTELAATVGATFTAALHAAHHTESLGWMTACAAETFDVILSDPPYGMDADQFGDSGGLAAGAHFYDDSYENWQKLMLAFAPLAFRVTKPQAHMYLFCDFDRFHELKEILNAEGWNCFRTPIVWVKPAGSRLPWVDFGPQRKFELCLYANKGRKPVTRIFPDVVSFNADDNLGHPAQKPVALFVDLLKRSVAPGNRVLDPFAGSGPIFPAAHELKCEATGLEQNASSYGICLKRLEALASQQELFSTDLKGLV